MTTTQAKERSRGNILNQYCLWSIQDMLSLPIAKILAAHANLSGFLQAISDANDVRVTPDSYADLQRHAVNLLDACERMGLVVTKAPLAEFSVELACAEQTGGVFGFHGDSFLRLKARLQSAMTCITYESSLKTALFLPPNRAAYYDPQSPLFGTEVNLQFPSAIFEIEEAGKCLAVGRDTAAVFHLMRVMEIGIHAVARCLGIPDPVSGSGRNWGMLLKQIQTVRTTRKTIASKGWTNPADETYFDAAYATLDAVRSAWRNTTMHVEKKYTTDEADHIFVAVRAFMMNLAARMDEQGQPLA